MLKIQITDAGFWKSVLQRFHAKKQNQVSAQMRPDDKRKRTAQKKSSARHVSLTLLHGSDKKNSFLAARVTQRLVTRTKGCAHGSRVWLWQKKLCAQLLLTGSDWTEKKSLAPLTRMHGCEEEKKKICSMAPRRTVQKWPNREKKKFCMHSSCWPDITEKRFCARSRMRPDSDQIKDSGARADNAVQKRPKKILRAPSRGEVTGQRKRKEKKSARQAANREEATGQ
jgi:hypothetical protein